VTHLKALVVDDSSDDALLLVRELRRGGYDVESRFVATRQEVSAALQQAWDVVVIDHSLPGFGGLEAIGVVRGVDADVPVIVVSGAVGEEAAVAAMRAGAQDFVAKENLSRFAPAVERELREAGVRRQARHADDTLVHTVDLLERTVDGAIRTLAFLAETRDPYTAGHQRRVTELAEAIAGLLRIDGDGHRLITAAGTLHDLGKTAVPAEILTKPGRLTEAEFELIRVHPRTGYDILTGIEFPWPVADVVLQHHERLDGSGYPDGLRVGDISAEARVLAVADVVEAMSSHRPYRPALGVEVALDEVERHRGALYDPEVVDACAALFNDGFRFS
jgi:HD-GYP domain-containing protein (c-di-GMP phosphodiesterase class II)